MATQATVQTQVQSGGDEQISKVARQQVTDQKSRQLGKTAGTNTDIADRKSESKSVQEAIGEQKQTGTSSDVSTGKSLGVRIGEQVQQSEEESVQEQPAEVTVQSSTGGGQSMTEDRASQLQFTLKVRL